MKTLQQIFEENGSRFPFKVIDTLANDDYWHEFHYEANGYFYGHEKCTDGIQKCVTVGGYKLYTEPKPKIKLWPYLEGGNGTYHVVYWKEGKAPIKSYIPHPTLPCLEIEAL